MHIHRHTNNDNHPPSAVSSGAQQEILATLHEWRHHLAQGSELAEALDPKRDHVRGNLAAPVAVVEYGEVGCRPGSREDRADREKLRGLLEEGKICFAFRHFPIIDSHPGAWLAAQALEAADHQGRFWDLQAALTDAVSLPWAKELDTPAILTVARGLGLDIERLSADMESSSTAARILRDLHGGFQSGVNGAPTFYVQGIRQDVDSPEELLERIEHAIEGDLAALWPPSHKHADAKARVVRAWHDGLADGDFSSATASWDDGIAWRGWNEELPGGGTAIGRGAVEDLHGRRLAAPAGFRVDPHEYIEHGDRVLVIGEARADAPGDGFRMPYVQIWEFDDGKAKRVETLTDTRAIANALAGSGTGR